MSIFFMLELDRAYTLFRACDSQVTEWLTFIHILFTENRPRPGGMVPAKRQARDGETIEMPQVLERGGLERR
jgi:hypothetical protein